MINIRLTRRGARNDPFYKIVAIEKDRKREGKTLDVIGYWHPKSKDLKFDKEKLNNWQKSGAKITPAVTAIIK